MSTNTYVALQTYTIPSAQASYTFDLSSISGYTDLVVVINGTTSSLEDIGVQVGNASIDTGTTYSITYMMGDGSTATSGRQSTIDRMNLGGLSTTQGNNIFHFMNYSNTTTYKTVLSRANVSSWITTAKVGLWRSTAAIKLIKFSHPNNFSTGTTMSIYGIANADVGAYATGGAISQDTTYYYHAFYNSGNFVPSRNLTCDVLVVGAGGGGSTGTYGSIAGAGAGSGIATTSTGLSFASGTSYTATLGAGGAGGAGSYPGYSGTNGTGTTFAGGAISLSASYGYGAATGRTGGGNASYSGGTYNPSGSEQNTGGGAGAGGNGQADGTGGIGVTSLGFTVGGGGGGNGAGGAVSIAGGGIYYGYPGGTDGRPNTGGGGAGGGGAPGGKGGSGLVVVRYAK